MHMLRHFRPPKKIFWGESPPFSWISWFYQVILCDMFFKSGLGFHFHSCAWQCISDPPQKNSLLPPGLVPWPLPSFEWVFITYRYITLLQSHQTSLWLYIYRCCRKRSDIPILKSLRLEKACALPGTYGLNDCRPSKHWYIVRTPYGSFIINIIKLWTLKALI